MEPERWKRIERIFQSALEVAPGGREHYLAAECAGDAELMREVESLLRQYEQAALETPAESSGGRAGAPDTAHVVAAAGSDGGVEGRRVGSYKLVREIGRGGMGTVYLAERADDEFRRRVAVKLINRGTDTDFALKRFRNERQILAALSHPYIARLLDGGTTGNGLPYFVMEHVEGEPLYDYCDARRLDLRERLTLFREVCEAVAYAHRNLVVHRDLKPTNILITASGTPKLLDFGIAKLLNPDLAGEPVTTATALRIMTPEYASPEQVRGALSTTASDTYSLGVLLYELTTGRRPYDLRDLAPQDVARIVCEEEPDKPSDAVEREDNLWSANGSDARSPEAVCAARSATADELRRALSGDLDRIVMKALRKEPGSRYQSAEQLSEDISLHLEGRPVSAPAITHAPKPAPRAAQGPTTGGVTLAVLPLKLFGSKASEDTTEFLGVGLADALITRLSNVRRFAVRPTSAVLRYGDPDTDPLEAGRSLGVGFVLDGRIRRAGTTLRVTVQLLDVEEGSSVWAGQFDETMTDVLALEDSIAERVAEELVPHLSGDERMRLARRTTDDPAAFEAYLRGRYFWNQFTADGFKRAIDSYRRAVELDPEYALAHAGIADYYNWLGVYCIIPFAVSAVAAHEAASRAVELDDTLAEAHSALGFAVSCRDFDWETADAHYRRALALNPNYATGYLWRCFQLTMLKRHDEAVKSVERAIEIDPVSPLNYHSLTWILYQARRFDRALESGRALAAKEPLYGVGYFSLGWVLRHTGRHAESVAAFERTVELLGRMPYLLLSLGSACAEAGDRERARAILEETRSVSAAGGYVSPYFTAVAEMSLGDGQAALSSLERALSERDAWIVWLDVEPHFDPLRTNPRFEALLRSLNFVR